LGRSQRWQLQKTGGLRENAIAIHRLTETIKRIFGYEQLEINASADKRDLSLMIDGRSLNLSEMGSGFAQFVLTLGNVAFKRPTFILIDEPELNLHPTLQLDFLATLASFASKGIVFATHSIGLARAYADRVYSIRGRAHEGPVLAPLEETRLAEFLGEMGYSAYRELGFDKVLLVEGVSEIKTVQQFLRKYRKDHRVVLIHMGGSDLINRKTETELAEITRICPDVSVMIDSERTSAGSPTDSQREKFRANCEALGMKCHVLERRALENYFTEAAVQQVKGSSYRALGPFDKPPSGWAKTDDNWRIAQAMDRAALGGTDLGMFLDGL
jgi:energy-coupling factor transporter ATP-binding protein EcfA2